MNTKNLKRWVMGVPVVILAVGFIVANPLTFGFCKNIDAVTHDVKVCLDGNGSLVPVNMQEIALSLCPSSSSPSSPTG